MQKKLIALAIAGLSGAAFAQSNVTIYGVADATFDNVKATGSAAGATDLQSRNRVTSNSSYIGFKGTEDLGGGMKAVWQLENGVNFDNGSPGAGAWNNRDSFVGVAGTFGTAIAGNVTGPVRLIGARMDVNTGATGIGANTALLGKIGGGAGASAFDQRINNALVYISPTWSGFHFAVGYTTGFTTTGLAGRETAGVGTSAAGNTGWTLGAIYDQGPLFAGYGYVKVKANNGAGIAAGVDSVDDHRLAAQYKFGTASVGVMWDRARATAVGGGDTRRTAWFIPVTWGVGNGKLIAQYGRAGDVTGLANSGANFFELGYEHSLSKRTVAKVLWAQVRNESAANYDFLYSTAGSSVATAAAAAAVGADPRGLSVGIRHSF